MVNFAGAFPGGGFGFNDMAALGLGLGPNAMGPGTGFGGTQPGAQASPGQQAAVGLGMGASGPSASFGAGSGFNGPSFGGFGGDFQGGAGVGGGAGGGGGGGWGGLGEGTGMMGSTHFKSPDPAPNPMNQSTHFKSPLVDPRQVNSAVKQDPISPSVMFPTRVAERTQPRLFMDPQVAFNPINDAKPVSPSRDIRSFAQNQHAMSPHPASGPVSPGEGAVDPGFSEAEADLGAAPFGFPGGFDTSPAPSSTGSGPTFGDLMDLMAMENQGARFRGGRFDGGGGAMPRHSEPMPLPQGMRPNPSLRPRPPQNPQLLAQLLRDGPPGGGR